MFCTACAALLLPGAACKSNLAEFDIFAALLWHFSSEVVMHKPLLLFQVPC